MDIATKVFLMNLIVWVLNYAFLRKVLDDIAKEKPEVKTNERFIRLNLISNSHAAISFMSIPAWIIYAIATW